MPSFRGCDGCITVLEKRAPRWPGLDANDSAMCSALDQMIFQGLPVLSHANILRFNWITRENKWYQLHISLQLTAPCCSWSGFIYIYIQDNRIKCNTTQCIITLYYVLLIAVVPKVGDRTPKRLQEDNQDRKVEKNIYPTQIYSFLYQTFL